MFARLVLLAFSASAIALATAPDDCLLVIAQPAPSNIDPTGKSLTLTMTNNCGKDITAYQVWFRDDSGQHTSGFAEERLGFLAIPEGVRAANMDILRAGATWSGGSGSPDRWTSVSATAVWYADMTTAGDPKDVAVLIKSRREMVIRYKKELDVLGSYDTYASAKKLPQEAAEAKAKNSPTYDDLSRLAAQFSRCDETSWKTFVQFQKRYTEDLIGLFEAAVAAQDSGSQNKTAEQ